jgi:hypothetical protein
MVNPRLPLPPWWLAAKLASLLIVCACGKDGSPAGGASGIDAAPPACLPVLAADPPAAGATVYLQSRASGQVVSAVAAELPATELRHDASAQQRFTVSAGTAPGSFTFQHPSGLCLTRTASGTTLGPCDQPSAAWQLQPAPPNAHHLKAPGEAQFLAVVDDRPTPGRALALAAAPSTRTSFLLVDASFRAPGISACDDPPLDQLTFLTTHNAFHTSGEGAKILPNQNRSIAQQLDDGVRGLMLDVYDFGGGVWTCHGNCLIPGLRGRPLSDHLQTIVAFLSKDPTAIVTLFFEDLVANPRDLCRVISETPGVSKLIFDPAQHGVHQRGWPRRSELLAANQRLLMFSQRPGREACGIQYDRQYTAENYWSLGAPGVTSPDISCISRWPDQPLAACRDQAFRPLFVFNHFRDTLYGPSCATDNGALLRQRALEICPQAAVAKPNFIAVDCYEVGDAAALVADLNRCDPAGCRCSP